MEREQRYNRGPAGLNKRFSAQARSAVGSRLGPCPRLSTVGGVTHQNQVDTASLVKLGITVTVEGTGGRIITDDPVFVESTPWPSLLHENRSAPGHSSIGRAAGKHISKNSRRRTGLVGKVGDHPDVVPGI